MAVITRLRLRLVALLNERSVALVAVAGVTDAVELVRRVRSLASLEAAELFFADGLALVRDHAGLPAPFSTEHPVYVLFECAGRSDPTDDLLEVLEGSDDLVLDATLASDARGRQALWAYRESHTESINAVGVPVKLDVAVPLASFAAATAEIPLVVADAAPGARVILFGHVNEGNLHVNVLDVGDHGDAVTDAVLKLVASFDGSISAEHGVGRAKRDWLLLSRSRQEVAAMRAVKEALDPQGLLNPGVLFG